MNRNVEIKARVPDLEPIAAVLRGRSGTPTRLSQCDTFFRCASGRLKLREETDAAELIFYRREITPHAKESRYWRSPIPDPVAQKSLLEAAYGIEGVVKKSRLLFLIGQTRVHLDVVEDLGSFVELEVVLTAHQTVSEGTQIAEQIMRELGIRPEDLVGEAYVELLQARQAKQAK
jgi:predicted adenylyl cyclase CyaB